MKLKHRPVGLFILDGWGYNPSPEHSNAIQAAHTPFRPDDGGAPHALVETSGEAVGLPEDRWVPLK